MTVRELLLVFSLIGSLTKNANEILSLETIKTYYVKRSKMLFTKDYKYFKRAKEIAMISDYRKIHIGCIAVYQGRIIGIGYNSNKTHPIQMYYNAYRISSDSLLPKLHAEIHCISQLKNMDINFSKVKLYIYRIRKKQPYGMARPCPSCMAAIRDLGIRDVYYTTDDGYTYEKIFTKVN
ncbi:MAG: deaminase [Eubacterium sp.]